MALSFSWGEVRQACAVVRCLKHALMGLVLEHQTTDRRCQNETTKGTKIHESSYRTWQYLAPFREFQAWQTEVAWPPQPHLPTRLPALDGWRTAGAGDQLSFGLSRTSKLQALGSNMHLVMGSAASKSTPSQL